MSFYQELKRRNVFRVAAAYTVAAWLLVQVAETIFPLFGFGDAPARIVVVVLAIGFVPALIISWVFEITPEGLKRDADVDREHSIAPYTGKKLDRIIIATLVVALVYFAVDKFVLDPQRDIDMTETAAMAGAEQAREEARLNMFSDKSIAVLPFANRSEQEHDEYFTDGMHDELLTRLSRIAALKVISRTSMMQYRGTAKSIPEIGKELSVATVLEGGVQRVGNQVRINVQLIDARTDEHLWAEIYDRELTAENLFAIQSEITTVIARSLEATLTPEETTRAYDLPTSSLEAYNHYLRGRQSMAPRTRESLRQALTDFEQAVNIDPDFALAWVGVADSVHLLAERGGYDRAEARERHRMAAEKALELDDQLGEAYTSMGFVYDELGEDEKRVEAFEKAIELNPNYEQAYHWYANTLSGGAREEKRLQLLLKAAQINPLSSIIQQNIARALYERGRTDEARDTITRLLEIDPDFVSGYSLFGAIESFEGHIARAMGHYQKAMQLDPGRFGPSRYLLLLNAALGNLEAMDDLLADFEAAVGKTDHLFWTSEHSIQLARGNYDAAIGVLEALPEQFQDWPDYLRLYATAYLLSGNYQSARDSAFKMNPVLSDRDRWQQELTEERVIECQLAGAIHEAGDEIGRDLLHLFIRNYEARLAEDKPTIGWSGEAMFCYLADGQYDVALDILDSESAEGHMNENWWYIRRLPWWEPLKDDPRYLELVDRIEKMLDEQRALLN